MSSTFPFLRARSAGVELDLVVQPRASRSALVGAHDGRMKVALAALPVDGEANAALVDLLSALVGVPKRAIRLLRGDSGRRKTVLIEGADLPGVQRVLSEVRS